jgi:hypothetical protein
MSHLATGFVRSLEVLVNVLLVACTLWLACYALWQRPLAA